MTRGRTPWSVFLGIAAAGLFAVTVSAASRARTATASVSVGALAKLSLSSYSLTFPDANPDSVPAIEALGGAVTITAKTRTTTGSAVNLSVQASDNLRSGTSIIAASEITWTATGTGFAAGTMSVSAAQTVGTWINSGVRIGTQTYFLANKWTYATGVYSATFVYTLSAP